MFIVDSHCHLYYEPYIKNLQKTIDECKSKNVRRFLSISVDLETSLKNIKFLKNLMKFIVLLVFIQITF